MGRTLSNQGADVTPVAKSMVTDPGTQAAVGYGDGADDSGNNVMRSAQLSEDGDSSGGNNDNNAAGIGLQLLSRGSVLALCLIDTTTNTLETPNHDTIFLWVRIWQSGRGHPSV